MARDVLNMRLPPSPTDRSLASLQGWIDTDVTRWVRERTQATDATRYHFTQPEEPSVAERVVGHAVIGLLHEDMALALSKLPAPNALDSEPEIAKMHAEIVEFQARPFFSAALVQFRECANAAVRAEPRIMRWAEFCHARFERLKSPTGIVAARSVTNFESH